MIRRSKNGRSSSLPHRLWLLHWKKTRSIEGVLLNLATKEEEEESRALIAAAGRGGGEEGGGRARWGPETCGSHGSWNAEGKEGLNYTQTPTDTEKEACWALA